MTQPYESKNKNVSHPQHYALIPEKNIEVIDVIAAATRNLTGIKAVCTGNVIKYILRWDKKNGKEDIEKAMVYLMYLKELLEEEERDHTVAH